MIKKKINIIGGGMAGMVAAIMLAKNGAKVTLFERNDKICKKILITGNGRCNLTNKVIKETNYHSSTKNIFADIYSRFDKQKTFGFFDSIGLDITELENGKIYPQTMQAMSVIKALLFYANEVGVEILYNKRILEVEYKNQFCLRFDNKSYYSDYLIIATGGKSYPSSGSSGDGYDIAKNFSHTIVEPMPSIVQLVTNNPYSKSLKGLKIDAKVELINKKDKNILKVEKGEVLFTDYGLSGPTILQLSTIVAPLLKNKNKLCVCIDLFPDVSVEELDKTLLKRFLKFPKRSFEEALNGFLNQRLIMPLLKYSNLDYFKQVSNVTKQERTRFANTLKNFSCDVLDTYTWNQAQVTKGGVNCNEIYKHSLESKFVKNLYFAGEILDIDGDCGGYNIQWAISSGGVTAFSILNS